MPLILLYTKKVFDSKKRYINLKKKIIKKLEDKNLNFFLKQIWQHDKKKIVWIGNPKLKEIEYNKAGYRIFVPSNTFFKESSEFIFLLIDLLIAKIFGYFSSVFFKSLNFFLSLSI